MPAGAAACDTARVPWSPDNPPSVEEIDALFDARSRARRLGPTAGRPAEARSDAPPRWASLVDAPVDQVVAAYEGAIPGRRERGAFYTPVALGRRLAELALEGWTAVAPPTVLDPACGAGNLLVAVADVLLERGYGPEAVGARLSGVDIDPVAAAIARGRLVEHLDLQDADSGAPTLAVGDALAVDLLRRPPLVAPFDVVVGNPPFGNAIERRTGRSDEERARYAAAFPRAATGAYDRAGLFVELALRATRHGGRVALVLPRALLSAPYAASLRAWIDAQHRLDTVLLTDAADHFEDAAVYVVGLVFEVGAPEATAGLPLFAAAGPRPGTAVRVEKLAGEVRRLPPPPDSRWSVLASSHGDALDAVPGDWVPLGSFATLQAGASAGEAYELADSVIDLAETRTEAAGARADGGGGASELPLIPPPRAEGWRLVTSGLIDPDQCHWGTRTCRYLKRDYAFPWLPRAAPSARRAALYDRPKVLVAGLSRFLEAVVDPDGSLAGAVATIAITVPDDDPDTLHRIADALNSEPVRRQFLALHGAQALGGGSVQVTKNKLAGLRVPPAPQPRA